MHQDMKEATDFLLDSNSGQIACRVLTKKNYEKDITIRSYKNGHKTEIDKLKEGYAKYYFYAWKTDTKILDYVILDIDVFRKYLDNPIRIVDNGDNTGFNVYPLKSIEDCILFQYEETYELIDYFHKVIGKKILYESHMRAGKLYIESHLPTMIFITKEQIDELNKLLN